jgi:protein-tyrosine phosphatase
MSIVPQDILVVCSGNICRSPFAEGYLRMRLTESKRDNVQVRSAGTLGIVGSPASDHTQELAKEAGFSLDAHRSSGVTFDLVDEAGVILVMEEAHRQELTRLFPEGADRVHLLSEYHPSVTEPSRAPDIFDPIGMSAEDYGRCFALVRVCIDGFLSSIEGN